MQRGTDRESNIPNPGLLTYSSLFVLHITLSQMYSCVGSFHSIYVFLSFNFFAHKMGLLIIPSSSSLCED